MSGASDLKIHLKFESTPKSLFCQNLESIIAEIQKITNGKILKRDFSEWTHYRYILYDVYNLLGVKH